MAGRSLTAAAGSLSRSFERFSRQTKSLNRRLILVDGPAGAGKTVFAEGLAAGLNVPLVQMEDLYLGWTGLEGSFRRLEELVLSNWLAGEEASFLAFDWVAGEVGERRVTVTASAALVVEGCGAAPRQADRYHPVVVWIDGEAEARLSRVLKRDVGLYAPELLQDWENNTASHFAREHTAERASIRLTGNCQ
jgi:uridine kinase